MDTLASRDYWLAITVVVLGAAGTYLLLPHRHGTRKPKQVHIGGGILAGIAALLFALFWRPPGPFLAGAFFYAFSLTALAGGLLTIASTNPVHSALWFASVVLSTSGLFLLAGAQFLAAGTVIVYAGAIIVTFLFVIMLAQMEGRAAYDRSARTPFRATFTCFLLFWGLLYSFFSIRSPSDVPSTRPPGGESAGSTAYDARLLATEHLVSPYVKSSSALRAVWTRASRPTSQLSANGKEKPHVAGLGETLYTDHLVTVELAGALLFVALIGALAIATPRPPIRPGTDRPSTAAAEA